ncbi:MAG: oligosaccharide flippase family protein [Actinomycetota bacterium]|nr:oligosaccharide flippase family protein [Actinomycetota bacterium]
MGISPGLGNKERSESSAEGRGDYLSILSGTGQNVIGIVIAALATFAANILLSRVLGPGGFGIVTVMTQATFVISFATRAGMDMAVLRDVAVEIGVGRSDRIRVGVSRATAIAALTSLAAAVAVVSAGGVVRSLFRISEGGYPYLVEAAAAGLPFLALANVWLSATRGLKIMRYTLYIFWAGQPIAWVLLILAGWQVAQTPTMSVLAYSMSWLVASVAAYFAWRKESQAWETHPMERGGLSRLLRYAGPRAPAALFSQLLFWTDLFVVTRYVSDTEVGVYSAALRAGQVLVLFLTSVSLMFSPYVADLHNRNETARLDRLFKAFTRWTLAATMPVFLVLAIAPGAVLDLFGPDYGGGETALLVLLAGQFVNVATGGVGFVLIMVGRTGWDLAVYAASLALNLGLAFLLAPRYGIEGAAIANAVTFALSKWARLALVARFVNIQPYDRNYLRLLAPTMIGLAVTWVVHQTLSGAWLVDLVVTSLAGMIAYAAAYAVLGLTSGERQSLIAAVARFRTAS